MRCDRKDDRILKRVIIAICMVLVAVVISIATSKYSAKDGTNTLTTYWIKDSTVAKSLKEYVTKVTNPNGKENFIPEKDHIAVFDMDGTLICETYFTYIVANSPIKDYVTPNLVIGTDFEVKQKGHENESSNMNYKYVNGDELVLTGGFIQKNLNGNKFIYIQKEIGQRPVLAFGNTSSDTSMLNYTIDSRNPYPAQAYMVIADDNVREWGKQDYEEKSKEYIAQGYIPISMKNDFAEIYEKDITRADVQYEETNVQKTN